MKANPPILLGIPFDANSSYLRGPAEAPPMIREALRCESSNLWTETGIDLGAPNAFLDGGDVDFSGAADAFACIEQWVGDIMDRAQRPVCLGGDHSITYPVLRAVGRRHPGLTLVHFDAHPDLYEVFEGNRLSHACPFARIMEEGLAKRLVQVGIRTMNAHQRSQAKKFGVEVLEMSKVPAVDRLRKISGEVYVSFDVDVLDPGFAPGISHREPGGMSVREAVAHLHAIGGTLVGADIVEYNPKQDVSRITAMVAGKILKEMLGIMIGGA